MKVSDLCCVFLLPLFLPHSLTLQRSLSTFSLSLSLTLSLSLSLSRSLRLSLSLSLSLSLLFRVFSLSLSLSLSAGSFSWGRRGGNSSSESCEEAVLLGLAEEDWPRIRQVNRLLCGVRV